MLAQSTDAGHAVIFDELKVYVLNTTANRRTRTGATHGGKSFHIVDEVETDIGFEERQDLFGGYAVDKQQVEKVWGEILS